MPSDDLIAVTFGDTIAERGRDYFRRGKVLNLKQSADGWRAQVAGSGGRAYSVLLQLFGSGGLKQGYCDCPYNELCKHLAAVWYAATAAETAEITRDDRPSESRRGAQTGGDELLADLRSLLGSYARGCDYWQSRRLAESLWPLQDQADMLPDAEQFAFLKTLYTRLNTIINRADDSDGLLGDCLFDCMESSEMLHRQTNASLKAKIEKFWYGQMQDSDKHWITADTAADYWQAALCADGRAAEVLAWLEGQWPQRSGFDADYRRDKLIVGKYHALTFLDEAAAADWLQSHLRLPELRRIAVSRARAAQNWPLAEQLLQQGVKTAGHNTELAREWRVQLLEIAEATGQSEAAAAYARALAVNPWQIDEGYYHRWKKQVAAETWPKAAAELEAQLQDGRHSQTALAQFYVLESRQDALAALLQQADREEILQGFIHRLDTDQQHAAALRWLDLLAAEAASLKERKHYAKWVKKLAQLLKRYPAIHARMVETVRHTRQQYANRPAMMQELDKLRF